MILEAHTGMLLGFLVIPFCHRIPITHGATTREVATRTTPSTREVAYQRQKKDDTTNMLDDAIRLCGCRRCVSVSFRFVWEAQRVKVLPLFSHLTNLSSSSWFDAVMMSASGVYAAPVSPTWSAQGVSFIGVETPGLYDLHLTFTHESDEQALAGMPGKQKKPAGRCLLLDLDGHLAHVDVPRCGYGQCVLPVDHARWVVDAANSTTTTDLRLVMDGVRLGFHDPYEPPKLVTQQNGTCMLLGDSHTSALHSALAPLSGWSFSLRGDGDGIYHNRAPDDNFNLYVKHKLPSHFVRGKMLSSLALGASYDRMQSRFNFSVWAFQSGHWDLRDASVATYVEHVAKLFGAFAQFRSRFRASATPLSLLWLGVPAYSFKRAMWQGMELRTNVKLHLADRQVRKLASQYGIRSVPFFSISYPLHQLSCDSHHYYCSNNMPGSQIGMAYARLVLHEINAI